MARPGLPSPPGPLPLLPLPASDRYHPDRLPVSAHLRCAVTAAETLAVGYVILNDQIVIDKPVKIDFTYANADGRLTPLDGEVLGTGIVSYSFFDSKTHIRLFKVVDGGKLELKEATLYTAFRRMETAGYIRSYWGDEAIGARRRYYSLSCYAQRRC